MKITEHSQIILNGATWKQAIAAVTPNISDLAPGFSSAPETWKELITDMGLDPEQVILSATHSRAYRHVEWKAGEEILLIEDPDEDYTDTIAGWKILTESNFSSATWESYESSITIERREDGLFDIIGTFPIEDGHRYEGAYYETLMQPVHQANAIERLKELATERKDKFYALMMRIIDETEIATLPGFQDWDDPIGSEPSPIDPELFKEIAGQFEVYTEEREILIYEQPVKALVFVGASGWDEWYWYQRDELASEHPGVEFPEYEPLVWGVCRVA